MRWVWLQAYEAAQTIIQKANEMVAKDYSAGYKVATLVEVLHPVRLPCIIGGLSTCCGLLCEFRTQHTRSERRSSACPLMTLQPTFR